MSDLGFLLNYENCFFAGQKQSSRGVLRKRYSENMHKFTGEHSCRKHTLWYGCSPENLLHIFRTHFPKTTAQGPSKGCLW